MHLFCTVDTTSSSSSVRSYIVQVHLDEGQFECPALPYETKYPSNTETNNNNNDEAKEMLCRGTYTILDTVSRSVWPFFPSFVSRWIRPSVTLQSTCDANAVPPPPPKKQKKNPIKGIIEGVHKLFHKKKKKTATNDDVDGQQRSTDDGVTKTMDSDNDDDWTKDVSAPLEYKVSPKQTKMIASMRTKFQNRLLLEDDGSNNKQQFVKRMEGVRWGGSNERSFSWWYPDGKNGGDGLMTAYLKVMHWPEDLTTNFPHNVPTCQTEGCPVEYAPSHTLEFREKFKPWLITPSTYLENKDGLMYVHGHSTTRYHDDASKGGFSLAWYTPGNRRKKSGNAENDGGYEDYTRVVLNTIETCTVDALNRSGGKIGKCNLVLDFAGFGVSMIPPIQTIKKLLKMLQDHFPDRLGVLVIMNMASAGQMILKLSMPFLPKVVKRKIHVLPNNREVQYEMLKELIDEKYIPVRFGGVDDFVFDARTYYDSGMYQSGMWSEKEGRGYTESMPYHA